ncbi:sigma-70 family RNA polymerase sigma factor [Chondrinema litorale]|uniref:sigma-70 family RNA polymerase sigma factor n=1 Tax=Chondrinema litorale TaxID=2994555 RepID=UPI002542A8AA|nr:sigma-70 family RNA polymerase sigma factor [Chondrinema litorale]UZR93593.1 sigma-70 family RNA polymerase sigma factor [Chondrinema litorale]
MNTSQAISLYQPVLYSIALRMVGSLADAEDIVQDTFLKWLTVDQNKIKNTKSYLIKAVTNNCINHLDNLKKKKKEYLETTQLPDFLKSHKDGNIFKFDLENELSEALAILHTKLEPMEKAIYILREAFNFEYEELQEVFDKKKDNCRQLFCRAKKNLEKEAQRFTIDLSHHKTLLESFKQACSRGVPSELINDLKEEFKFNKK